MFENSAKETVDLSEARIEEDRHQGHDAACDDPDSRAEAEDGDDVDHQREEERAKEGTRERAPSACQRCSAEDRRRNARERKDLTDRRMSDANFSAQHE